MLDICLGNVSYCKIESLRLWLDLFRLIKFPFKNLIDVGTQLRSENFVEMLMCFPSSMACTYCFEHAKVAFLKKPFTKGVIFVTTYNHILD